MPRTLVTPVTRDPGLSFRCCDLHLRAAMSPQRRGSVSCAHHPPQRRRWLEEALGSMSVDIVQQLTNGIKILNSEAEDEVKEEVLDQLEDWLGNIDMAVNFHKVGGLPSLERCLASSSR